MSSVWRSCYFLMTFLRINFDFLGNQGKGIWHISRCVVEGDLSSLINLAICRYGYSHHEMSVGVFIQKNPSDFFRTVVTYFGRW
ncbi:hypothetical protein BJY01DRAFT_228129 [Aspergillus pseudoustus]|uniref:Uncharacterized protein n=1 Tax=Aspergillus pseudoustus TaxID=1810923 RepID=A0ABR4IMQ7_9EURO